MKVRLLLLVFILAAGNVLRAQEPVLKLPTAHTAWITQFALSHNGKWVATASYDNTIKIWDLRTRRELKVLRGHKSTVNAVRFSPDDRYILSGASDAQMRVWNVQEGNCVRTFDTLFSGMVSDVDFSPDGTLVAGCGSDRLRVFDLRGDSLLLMAWLDAPGIRLRFHPGGRKIACAQQDSLLSVWAFKDSMAYVPEESFYYRHGKINDFFYTGDGSMIVAAVDCTIENVRLAKISQSDSIRFTGHALPALAVCPGKNGDEFYSLSCKATSAGSQPSIEIRKWGTRQKTPLDSFVVEDPGSTSPLSILAFDPQERILYGNKRMIGVVSSGGLHFQEKIESHTSLVNSVYRNGAHLITTSESGQIRFMNLKTGRVEVDDLDAHISRAYYLPDRPIVLLALRKRTASGHDTYILRYDWKSRIRDTLLYEKDAVIYPTPGFRISADASKFAFTLVPARGDRMVLEKKQFRIWNCKRRNYVLKLPAGQIWDVDFLAGKKNFVLTSGTSNVLYLRQGNRTIKLADTVQCKGDFFFDVSVLDRSRALVAYQKGVQIWNLRSRRLEKKIPVFLGGHTRVSLWLHPDRKKALLAQGDTLRVLFLEKDSVSAPIVPGVGWFYDFSLSSDERELLLTGIDNSIRVWDQQGQREKYKLVYIDSADHIFITPDGYYQSSRTAAQQVHYATPDMRVITFEQLDVQRNRPDLVLRAIGEADTVLVTAYQRAWVKRLRRLGMDTIQTAQSLSLPEADFADRDSIPSLQSGRALRLRIRAQDRQQPLSRLNLWINECPLFGSRGLPLPTGRNTLDTLVTVTLSTGVNVLETSVFNAAGTESYRSPLTVYFNSPIDTARLHFIGIGIDSFADGRYNLRYSVKDQRDLAKALSRRYSGRLTVDTLFNGQVSTEAVQALKERLQKGSADDKVILSYSGHGLLDKDLNYYLSTYRVDFSQPQNGGLPYDVLEALLDSIPARRKLILIDACHSGEVDKEDLLRFDSAAKGLPEAGTKGIVLPKSGPSRMGMKNSFELMQELFVDVSRRTGATVISAAAGTQLAREGGSVPNGVFTYSILEFLEQSPTGTVNDLKRYVNERVQELTKGLQVPTSRAENKLLNWQIW